MKFFTLLLLVWIAGLTTPVSAISVPKTAPLYALVNMSSAAVEVKILSGYQIKNTNHATYQITLLKTYFGVINKSNCFFGPSGMKIGQRYVVLVKNYDAKDECQKIKILGRRMPAAFEIDTMNDNIEYVRIDNRELIVPKVPGQLQIKQLWDEGGPNENIVVLGTVAPTTNFISVLVDLSAKSKMDK